MSNTFFKPRRWTATYCEYWLLLVGIPQDFGSVKITFDKLHKYAKVSVMKYGIIAQCNNGTATVEELEYLYEHDRQITTKTFARHGKTVVFYRPKENLTQGEFVLQ